MPKSIPWWKENDVSTDDWEDAVRRYNDHLNQSIDLIPDSVREDRIAKLGLGKYPGDTPELLNQLKTVGRRQFDDIVNRRQSFIDQAKKENLPMKSYEPPSAVGSLGIGIKNFGKGLLSGIGDIASNIYNNPLPGISAPITSSMSTTPEPNNPTPTSTLPWEELPKPRIGDIVKAEANKYTSQLPDELDIASKPPQLIKTQPQKPDLIAEAGKSFKALGAESAKALNEGISSFMSKLDDIASYVSDETGLTKGDIFKKSAEEYKSNADYWDQRAKENGANVMNEIVGNAMGGAIPGVIEFGLSVPYAAMTGAAEAHKEGKDELSAALKAGGERAILGGIFHSIGKLTKPLAMGASGFVGGLQSYLSGGDIHEIAKNTGAMALFGLMGGGDISAKDVAAHIKETFGPQTKNISEPDLTNALNQKPAPKEAVEFVKNLKPDDKINIANDLISKESEANLKIPKEIPTATKATAVPPTEPTSLPFPEPPAPETVDLSVKQETPEPLPGLETKPEAKPMDFISEVKGNHPELSDDDINAISKRTADSFTDMAQNLKGQAKGSALGSAKAWNRFAETQEEQGPKGGKNAFEFGKDEFNKQLDAYLKEKNYPRQVPAGSLAEGDSFTIKGEGYKVEGTDPNTGNLIIKDGQTLNVDPFEMLSIDGGMDAVKPAIPEKHPVFEGTTDIEQIAGVKQKNLNDMAKEVDAEEKEPLENIKKILPGGYLTSGTNIESLKKQFGDFPVVVKDVNGNRGLFNINDFQNLIKNKAFRDRVRAVFVPASPTPIQIGKPEIQKGFMSKLDIGKFLELEGASANKTGGEITGIEGLTIPEDITVSPKQRTRIFDMVENEKINQLLTELGIKEIKLAEPNKFSLSEQANVNVKTKVLTINVDADDPTFSTLHELGHLKYQELNNAQKESFKNEILTSKEPYRKESLGGYIKKGQWEEVFADDFAFANSGNPTINRIKQAIDILRYGPESTNFVGGKLVPSKLAETKIKQMQSDLQSIQATKTIKPFALTPDEIPTSSKPKLPEPQSEMFQGSETMQSGRKPIIAEEPKEFFKKPEEGTQQDITELHAGLPLNKIDIDKIPVLNKLNDIKNEMASWLAPTTKSPEHLKSAETIAARLGEKYRREYVSGQRMEDAIKYFRKEGVDRPENKGNNAGTEFIDKMQTGQQLNDKEQKINNTRDKEYEIRKKLMDEAGVPIENPRDNYAPGMWSVESRRAFNQAMGELGEAELIARGNDLNKWTSDQKAEIRDRVKELLAKGEGSDKDYLQYLTKRPLEGKEGFRKEKTFDLIKTGREFGLEPISENPIELDRLKLEEMDRSILGNQIMNDFKSQGKKKFLKLGQKLPPGFVYLDDPKLGEVRYRNDAGEMVIAGHNIVTQDVADVLNNFTSKSLYQNRVIGTAYSGVMATSRLMIQTRLGMGSFFHGGTTTVNMHASAVSDAIQDTYRLAIGKGGVGQIIKDITKIPTASIRNEMQGKKYIEAYGNPEETDPTLKVVSRAAELAGFRVKMTSDLLPDEISKLQKAWYAGNKPGIAGRSITAGIQGLALPIQEIFVPRAKWGVFGDAVTRIVENNPGKTLEELTPQFRQVVNRIDEMYGQVGYERLFMDNAAKNLGQFTMQASGWTGGTISMFGGAVKDTIKFFNEWRNTGKPPEEMPRRVANVLGTLFTVWTLNGLLNIAFTHELPHGLDWWMFRDGGQDDQGRPTRMVLPAYTKDLIAYFKAPIKTIMAKQNPILSAIAVLTGAKNKNYYGAQISPPDASTAETLIDRLVAVGKENIPFWIQGLQKVTEEGGGLSKSITEHPVKTLFPQIGIMPAPKSSTFTPAEQKLSELREAETTEGGRTKEQYERSQTNRLITEKIRKNEPVQDDIHEAIIKGIITQRDVNKDMVNAKLSSLQIGFKPLNVADAIKVFSVADSQEREMLSKEFLKKLDLLNDLPPKQRNHLLDTVNKIKWDNPQFNLKVSRLNNRRGSPARAPEQESVYPDIEELLGIR